jgi:hypothetical protein
MWLNRLAWKVHGLNGEQAGSLDDDELNFDGAKLTNVAFNYWMTVLGRPREILRACKAR